MKKNMLSLQKRISIYEYLKSSIEKTDGGCRYKDGGNDKAAAIRLDCTETNVRSIREEMFGPLVKRKKHDVEELVLELMDRVEKLEKASEQYSLFVTN